MKFSIIPIALSITLLSSSVAWSEETAAPDLSPVLLEPSPMVLPGMAQKKSLPLAQQSEDKQIGTLRNIPGGANLIYASQFKTGRSSNLTDMLKNQPGVIIGTRGSGDEARISIRGSGVDRNFHLRGVKLLQDGIPMNMGDGNADFQWIEPFAVENIEVYRGGNATQYGSTTLGGAINLVSPTGYTAPRFQTRVETGSYGYIKGQVSSGGVFGKLDYYASGTGSYQNGFQKHSRSQAQRYIANVGYRLQDNLETRFYIGYVNSKLQLPGSLTRSNLYNYPRGAAPNSLDFDEQHNIRQLSLANKTIWRISENQQLEGSVYWINHQLNHPLFWSPFFLNGLGFIDNRTNTYGSTLRYINTHTLLGQQNRFTIGLNPHMSFANNQRFQNLSGMKKGFQTAASGEFSSNFDLYAENQHTLFKGLALVTGANASYAVRNYHDRFHGNPNGNQTRNQDYLSVNPKVGLIYNFTPTIQAYTNYNRSFEPATLLEIVQLGGIKGNTLTVNLKPQVANTLEFGTRGSIHRAAWDLTFYQSWLRNELLSLNDSLGLPQGTINASRTIHQGVEAGASLVLVEGILSKSSKAKNLTALSSVGSGFLPEATQGKDRLVLRQVYDWSYFRFENDTVYRRNRLPGAPPHLSRTELIYEHPCGLYIQPNLEWSLAHYSVDYTNTMNVNPFAVLGVRAGYRSKRGWSAFIEFRNLTNKRYPSAVQVIADASTSFAPPRVFSPGQGFSVYGGIELGW